MENTLIELATSQGIWVVLFVFFFLYAIKTNEKLIEKQEKRETNYQNLISVLTEKYDILNDLKDEINHIKNILGKDRDT